MIRAIVERYGRLVRFIVVGGGTTLGYSLLTAALIAGPSAGHRVEASAIASLVMIPISFLAHRRFTYADTARRANQTGRFALLALVNFGLNVGDMHLSAQFHWPYWTAILAGWFLIPTVNFVINTVWVFRAPRLLSIDAP